MNTIETNIDIFKKWVKDNAHSMYSLLRDGASDQELIALEQHIAANLPEPFKAFYRIMDGQTESNEGCFKGKNFLNIEGIISEYDTWNELLNDGIFKDEDGPFISDPDKGVKNDWWNPLWIPITADGSGNNLCIDLDPAIGGTKGQIITMFHDSAYRCIEAVSFDIWFDQYVNDLVNGKYEYSENMGIMDKGLLARIRS